MGCGISKAAAEAATPRSHALQSDRIPPATTTGHNAVSNGGSKGIHHPSSPNGGGTGASQSQLPSSGRHRRSDSLSPSDPPPPPPDDHLGGTPPSHTSPIRLSRQTSIRAFSSGGGHNNAAATSPSLSPLLPFGPSSLSRPHDYLNSSYPPPGIVFGSGGSRPAADPAGALTSPSMSTENSYQNLFMQGAALLTLQQNQVMARSPTTHGPAVFAASNNNTWSGPPAIQTTVASGVNRARPPPITLESRRVSTGLLLARSSSPVPSAASSTTSPLRTTTTQVFRDGQHRLSPQSHMSAGASANTLNASHNSRTALLHGKVPSHHGSPFGRPQRHGGDVVYSQRPPLAGDTLLNEGGIPMVDSSDDITARPSPSPSVGGD